MKLDKFLIEHVLRNYDEESGIFPHGHNGLYLDQETSLRNNAHYLCILNYLYRNGWNEAKAYIESILIFIESFEGEHNYQFRLSHGKDQSNGLIGLAWLIEGIVSSLENGIVNKSIVDRIASILSSFDMNEIKGIWINRFEPDGAKLGIDRTLNHQIWFTAMVARLNMHLGSKELDKKVMSFIENYNDSRKLNRAGLYYHTVNYSVEYYKTRLKRILKSSYRAEMRVKEVGYHSFNLLGVHLLSKYSGKSLFDAHNKDMKALRLIESASYRRSTYENPYGYPYNPIGFEHAVLQSYYPELFCKESVVRSINEQFKYWDASKESMITIDSNTSNARIYEMTYINPDLLQELRYCEKENVWSLEPVS